MSSYGILRVEKIKSRSAISGRASHNLRSTPTVNADATRANHDLRPDLTGTMLKRWDAVLRSNGNPRYRHDAVLALEVLQTFSPEAAASISAIEWGEACLRFNERVFGRENIISSVLHLDEKTPHVHTLIVPIHNGRLTATHWIDGRRKCRALQDDFYAEVGSRFCLQRGQVGSSRKHLPQKVLYASSNALQNAANSATQSIDSLTLTTPTIKWPEFGIRLATTDGREAYLAEVRAQVDQQVRDQLKGEQFRVRNLIQPLIEIARESQLRAEAFSRTETRLLRAMKKEQTALAALRAQSMQLRDIPLPDVAERYLGFAGAREGAALVWDCDQHRLVVTGAKFKDFKADQGRLGGGAIDLGMHLLGCDYSRAIRWLAYEFGAAVQGAIRTRSFASARNEATQARVNAEPVDFAVQLERFAARCDVTIDRVRTYLSAGRRIPLALVDQLIDRGQLWSNKFGACVFGHRDRRGELRGCTVRGTKGEFKQTIGDKSNAWFSIGEAIESPALPLIVVESPIDALSYGALYGGDGRTVVSTGGAADCAGLIALRRSVVAAFDADEAGNRMAEQLNAAAAVLSISCIRQSPPEGSKDWNDFVRVQITKNEKTHEQTKSNHRPSSGLVGGNGGLAQRHETGQNRLH